MENKNLRELERGILLKLREAVNSQEEYDWVLAELAALDAEEPAGRDSAHPIATVAEAVRLLEEQCGFVAVQVEIVPALWELECRADVFSGTYTETEVVQLAHGEYALHLMRSEAAKGNSPARPGGWCARGAA